MLPYDVLYSSMITTANSKNILVGGYSIGNNDALKTLLELHGITSNWKEIKFPLIKLRNGHIAFKGTSEQMKIFCGKLRNHWII